MEKHIHICGSSIYIYIYMIISTPKIGHRKVGTPGNHVVNLWSLTAIHLSYTGSRHGVEADDEVPVGKGGRQRKVLKESIQALGHALVRSGRLWLLGFGALRSYGYRCISHKDSFEWGAKEILVEFPLNDSCELGIMDIYHDATMVKNKSTKSSLELHFRSSQIWDVGLDDLFDAGRSFKVK